MRFRTALLAAAFAFSLAPAHAYVYDVGPNYVNMSGAACKPSSFVEETFLHRFESATTTNSNVGVLSLFCPIQRRGTTFYRGTRLPGYPSLPPEPSAAERKVNISGASVWGSDGSTFTRFTCALFVTRMSDQSEFFGVSKSLCASSSFGCTTGSVANSWTGANRLVLSAPSGFNNADTVNFGIKCDVGRTSSVYYSQTTITPN